MRQFYAPYYEIVKYKLPKDVDQFFYNEIELRN